MLERPSQSKQTFQSGGVLLMILSAMIRIAKSATIAIALLVLGIARVGLAAPMIDPAKIVDLTYTFDASTIYWPD